MRKVQAPSKAAVRRAPRKTIGKSIGMVPLLFISALVLGAMIFSAYQSQSFLSNAADVTYTAGVTAIGSKMDSGNNNGVSATNVVTGANSGKLSSISVYVGKVNASPRNHMQVALYTDNGLNAPGAFLAASTSNVVTAKKWNTFTLTPVVINANTKYWLAFNVDGANTQYAISSAISPKTAWKIPTSYGNWPNPLGSLTEAVASQQYSIYMTYTAQIATPTPTALPTATPMPTVTPVPGVPTPTPTSAPTGSRDPLKQPFASDSIWNMPIGSGAVYVPARMEAVPSGDVWAPMPQIDDEHIVLRPTAPLTAINYSNAGWSGKSRCAATGGLLASVPIPSDYLVPNDNTNSGAAFLMADGRTIIQSQPFARCTIGGPATSIIKFDAVDLYGDGRLGAHGGSRLSSFGGSIRMGELRPGGQAPRHAVKVNVDAPRVLYPCQTESECFRWPAFTSDSGSVGDYGSNNPIPNPALKMGSLLAIPASVNINNLGLESEPGKMLAWTLQNYGAYIVDATGGPAFALSAEHGPDGSKRTEFRNDWGFDLEQRVNTNTAWSRDMQKLVQALNVVDNNSPTSIGGGGTPLQPLASPIAP